MIHSYSRDTTDILKVDIPQYLPDTAILYCVSKLNTSDISHINLTDAHQKINISRTVLKEPTAYIKLRSQNDKTRLKVASGLAEFIASSETCEI